MVVLKPRQTRQLPASRGVFRSRLVEWFETGARDYPWRRTHDPYAVLVSEIMLQQTQISTVLSKGYYLRFLEAFPDIRALSEADDAALLKAWEGLGYYRRARMLRDTARAVLATSNGNLPEDLDALLDLPGIGPYTAGALRAFAFGKPAVLVDGNVSRVLSRLMDFHEEVDSSVGQKKIWSWAKVLADDQNPRSYHAALMELGQRLCRPKHPDCHACPVSDFCATSAPELLPIKKTRLTTTALAEHAIWVCNDRAQILMHQEQGSQRTGLWKLPIRDSSAVTGLELLTELKYGITRYRVTLRVYQVPVDHPIATPKSGDEWVEEGQIAELAMAAPFRKAIKRVI